jgi:hypothetical protein
MDWRQIRYFKPEEFDDPKEPGSWKFMSEETITLLEWLRRDTGWPIITHNKFGLRGTVCVLPEGHSDNSHHYANCPDGCSAVDWHFNTDADPREQACVVFRSRFRGIGVYYRWEWNGRLLPIGFHTDMRRRYQVWKKEKGVYIYLLN